MITCSKSLIARESNSHNVLKDYGSGKERMDLQLTRKEWQRDDW